MRGSNVLRGKKFILKYFWRPFPIEGWRGCLQDSPLSTSCLSVSANETPLGDAILSTLLPEQHWRSQSSRSQISNIMQAFICGGAC